LCKRHTGLQATDGKEIVRIALINPRAAGLDRFRHHYRNEHLRIVGDLGANKSFWRDADNSERMAVELDGLPHDMRIARETVLPAVVTNHRNRM